jgi:hypothetical protein
MTRLPPRLESGRNQGATKKIILQVSGKGFSSFGTLPREDRENTISALPDYAPNHLSPAPWLAPGMAT